MGDRAYVRLTCRQEDVGRFEQIGFVEDCAEGEMAVSMVDEEANYAHYSELTQLANLDRVREYYSALALRKADARDERGRTVTRLDGDKRVRRETSAIVQRKPLVVEIRPHTIYVRLKGARWGYEVDYQSIWVIGAKKAAEQARIERQNKRMRWKQAR